MPVLLSTRSYVGSLTKRITREYSVEHLSPLKLWQTLQLLLFCNFHIFLVHYCVLVLPHLLGQNIVDRHLPSEGIHSKSHALSFLETITNKYLITSISIYMKYIHPHPPTSTPFHSTGKVECPTQPIIGQCTHIYPTDRNNEWLG